MPSTRRLVWVTESRTSAIVPNDVGRGHGREVLVVGRRLGLAFEVDELGEQRHAAHAVGDRVVHLHRERGTVAFEAFEQRELPQRARTIERSRRDRLQRVEQRRRVARWRQPQAAQVEVEVEGRLDRPAGRPDAQRRRRARAGAAAG